MDDIETLTEETKKGLNNLVTNLMKEIQKNLSKENALNSSMYMGIVLTELRESVRNLEEMQRQVGELASGGTASGRKIRSKTMRRKSRTMRRQQRRGSRTARRQQRRGSRTMRRQQRRGTPRRSRTNKRNKRRSPSRKVRIVSDILSSSYGVKSKP